MSIPSPFLMIGITDNLSVYRFIKTSQKEYYDTSPVFTGIKAQITPASNDILAFYPDIPAAQLFEIYIFTNDTLINGDKMISAETSNEFIIRGEPAVYNEIVLGIYYQKIVGVMVV